MTKEKEIEDYFKKLETTIFVITLFAMFAVVVFALFTIKFGAVGCIAALLVIAITSFWLFVFELF